MGIGLTGRGHVPGIVLCVQGHGQEGFPGNGGYTLLHFIGKHVLIAFRRHQDLSLIVIIKDTQGFGRVHVTDSRNVVQLHTIRKGEHHQQHSGG